MATARLSGKTAFAYASRSSQWCRVATNTMVSAAGSGAARRSAAQNAAGLSRDRVVKNAMRSVSESVASCSRRTNATSSRNPARANAASSRGIVAEKSSVWRSGLILVRSCCNWSAKPISKSRSASSKTQKRQLARLINDGGASSSKCARRPGVAWSAAGRFASAANWPSMDSPPTNGAWPSGAPPTETNLAMVRAKWNVCIASSRVGDSTHAAAASFWSKLVATFWRSGMRNAAVLPAPVRAMHATSRPSSAGGRTARCTGVG
mmetsp:Transcript_5045/g.15959  ORF Transcript_5045/g.15959 Transcript_5045/m.15959 type:complete len:264 (+) Transcript_5045:328-1119(+)